jgi:hypothetical protein
MQHPRPESDRLGENSESFVHYGLDDQPLDSWADIDEYSSGSSNYDSGSSSDEYISPESDTYPEEGAAGGGRKPDLLYWDSESDAATSVYDGGSSPSGSSGSSSGCDSPGPGRGPGEGSWDWSLAQPTPAGSLWDLPPVAGVYLADGKGSVPAAAIMAYAVPLPRLGDSDSESGPESDGGSFLGYSEASSGSGSDSDSSGSTAVSRHQPERRPRLHLGDACACIYCGVGPDQGLIPAPEAAPPGGAGLVERLLADAGLADAGLDAKKTRKRRRNKDGAGRKVPKMGRCETMESYL